MFMRSHSFYLGVLLLGIAILSGCANKATKIGGQTTASNGTQTPANDTGYPDGATRITIPDLQEKIKKNEVFIIDVRNQASFDAGHIPGSRLIPSGEVLNHVDELPKDKLIVTYCS
jgi:3-mercaptopyruvate sulfurtransferase SseA